MVAIKCMQDQVQLSALNPRLFESLCAIWVYNEQHLTRKDIALRNAKLSVRSSIRKPWNCVMWLCVIQDLQETEGVDGSQMIKQWNTMSTKDNQLSGGKRVGLLLMLAKMPNSVRKILVKQMSEDGPDNSLLGDDVLADKRVYPGHRFPAGTPQWSDRMLITAESMELMVAHLITVYQAMVLAHILQPTHPPTHPHTQGRSNQPDQGAPAHP